MADIGISNIVTTIASSTTSYLLTYKVLFVFIIGLVLAIAVIGALIDRAFPENTSVAKE
jgi:cytochrome c biogenesis protein CcdA